MRIVLVVGASGVGKDTLLRSARARLKESNKLGFVRRYITRPPDTHEDNYFIDLHGFKILQQADFFLSSWQAHGNFYGIPHNVFAVTRHTNALLCSISRRRIIDFENRFDHVTTIQITASEEILRQRLYARGRESEQEIAGRLLRAREQVEARDLIPFDNSMCLEKSIPAFMNLLGNLS